MSALGFPRSNAITPEERAMIDAAIRERGVTTCEPGARATAAPWVWNGYQLVLANPPASTKHTNVSAAKSRRRGRATRESVAAALASGKSADETAALLGVTGKTVREHVRAIRTAEERLEAEKSSGELSSQSCTSTGRPSASAGHVAIGDTSAGAQQ